MSEPTRPETLEQARQGHIKRIYAGIDSAIAHGESPSGLNIEEAMMDCEALAVAEREREIEEGVRAMRGCAVSGMTGNVCPLVKRADVLALVRKAGK